MWKNLRLRPILASVLVLAFAREAFADVEANEWVTEPVFTKRAWREGEESAAVTNGVPKFGESVISYSNRFDGAVTSEMPESEGLYTVRFTVAAAATYTGLETAVDFTIAASAAMKNGEYFSVYDYAGRADFTVDSAAVGTNAFEKFPVYVKIKNRSPEGFEYGDLKNGTDDLRFFDSTGQVLPYEIETWNTSGESTFWVLLPTIRQGVTFTMCWNLRDGCKLPGNDPTKVWGDYVGVWHFGETIGTDTAAETPTCDSTGNGYAAMPVTYATGTGDLRDQTYSSTDSVFGHSRHNSYGSQVKKGCRFEVLNSELMKLGDTFTFTGWFKSEHIAGNRSKDGAVIVSRKTKQDETGGWYAQMYETWNLERAMKEIYAQGGSDNNLCVRLSDEMMTNRWTFLCLAYNGGKLTVSGGNKSFMTGTGAVTAATDNEQILSFGNFSGKDNSNYCSFDGFFDEFRIRKGAVTNSYLELEYAQGTNCFVTAGTATNDTAAVLKNDWKSTPSISQTVWEAEKGLPTLADFDLGEPNHNKGTQTIVFYDRTTGAVLGSDVPKRAGEFRAIVTVEEQEEGGATWGALEYAMEFRILADGGSHEIGINVDRILLLNDDYSVDGGDVEWQSYSDELETDDHPYWQHLDENGENASSTPSSPKYEDDWSVVLDFNLGGGTRHVCWYRGDWMWFLDGIRIGNTFNNGAFYPEETGTAGLSAEQNYLPWNAESQRVIGYTDYTVGDLHRYVGQAVMQNKMGAAIESALYTNGIGTVYFDAVNGWANNVSDVDGSPNYKLKLQVATMTKVDKNGETHAPELRYTSSNPTNGAAAYDPFYYAAWEDVPMHVLLFYGTGKEDCVDLGMQDELTLGVEEGGSCERFYRIVAPVTNAAQNARFRIVRTAIDPIYELNPDGEAYILLDNIICSPPTGKVQLEPYGEYFPQKTGKQILGREGAFDPPFPSAKDIAIYGRAKGTFNGLPISEGAVAAATMHYRWHYLDQKVTDWKYADLDPATLVSLKPLELPPFEGDIEFWFDLNQSGDYYKYADYSGTGHDLGGIDFSEEITSVTNQAPTAVQLSDGTRMGDWFVRLREAKSDYSEMKVVVKGIGEFDMVVSDDRVWRGFVSTSNIVNGGVYWRIEPRNRQTEGAKAWNWSTNYWYVMDWDSSAEKPPEFPAAGRMSEGTTNSWCQMPKNAVQTGYLMFQVDESSMGVTVIRADYENFKDWNGSNGDYFVGSFTDPSAKKGSSATARTYDESYADWTDTVATNSDWELHFDHKIGESEDWIGYKMFSSAPTTKYYASWPIGKGMWVYGKYREPDSNIALQMAGCGEGYVEFSPASFVTWPRGIGSVSFKARVAQPISPEYAVYNEVGAWISSSRSFIPSAMMTNYTFLTRACFDQQANKGFSGNAALSLFAYFRSGKGGYEARWEQVKGKMTTNPDYETEEMGPDLQGQRLILVRWNWAGNGYVEKELIATTNSAQWKFDMPTMNSTSLTNNLMPFLISAYHTEDATYITAAVRVNKSKSLSGVPPFDDASSGRGVDNQHWYFVTYKDIDPENTRFTSGTYGVLSSNCEGMFVTPEYRLTPTWPYGTYGDMTKVPTKNNYSETTVKDVKDFESCVNDLADGWWTISWSDPGRIDAFYDEDKAYRSTRNYGLTYVPPEQWVDIYTKPRTTSGNWTRIGQVDLIDFGTPGLSPDCVTNLYSTSDCYVRLQTGGELGDFRTDVAVSDIVLTQWRGEDDWSTKDKESTAKQAEYGRTNIVFTTGWVTNGAVRLSAKRTAAGTASSVRSPLFDGYDGRSVGLGRFDFWYRPPHTTNIALKVQICTNFTYQSGTSLKDMSLSVTEGDGNRNSWYTWTNLTYEALSKIQTGESYGHFSLSLGMHGVKGLMRVVVDNDLVKQVANVTDSTAFGEIDIVAVECKDEPALDKGCWWGWNMQTIGDSFDRQRRMFLPDCPQGPGAYGQSLALNNSTTADVDPAERTEDVRLHVPFVQSPTFTNAVIGQVSFKARTYELSPYAPAAKVFVYGAAENPDNLPQDVQWKFIAEFPVTNALYTTYTCKTDAQNYYALRLAVVLPEGETDNPPSEAEAVRNPQRVLIDEVSISEAVRAMLSFRNVGAFRTNLVDNAYVEGVTTKEQQPLCDENWGVQGELFATMLGDEIYMEKGYEPRVWLHWYVGKEPWGYANWKALPIDRKSRTRYSVELKQSESSNLVYRSSYKTSADSVLPAQTEAGTVVQYMLEVRYWTLNSTKVGSKPVAATNWLDSASWTVPDWYAPVDYNSDAQYGAGKAFSAFTILDTVAPGWAWINEMNVFGVRQTGGGNSEQALQFCEICAPAEADLSGWKVRMLDAYLNGKVTTNNIATFGVGKLTGKKQVTVGMREGMLFRSVGTKAGSDLKYEDGSLDAPWAFSYPYGSFAKGDGYYYISDYEQPIGVQLLRPSGTIEHSIVVIGTNRWGRLPGTKAYDPTNFVAILNRSVPGSRFFYAGEDCCGAKRTDSVMRGQGESASVWTNNWVFTPGFINHAVDGTEQIIGQHPSPQGDSIIIYASVDTTLGHIQHQIGDDEITTDPQMIVLRRGSETGTNITYYVAPWYELASVTTNDAKFWEYKRRVRETNMWVGVHASNNLYVVGTAQVDSDLREQYGLTEDNPFTPAVMDWLEKGTTLQRDAEGSYKAFANPGEIHLADFAEYGDPVSTNLTLTQMYCLDMDPTVGNLLLEAGYAHIGSVPRGTLENGQLTMFMMITNRNDDADAPVAWSPYVLRGLAPGSHSWQFKNASWTGEAISSWTSETFKVTGILVNGYTSRDNPDNYIPLNWFVFHPDSFYQETANGHERFTAEIEVLDPHSQSSPGADSGWYDWCQQNPGTLIGWGWAVDLRSRPVGAEVLRTNNYWTVTTP